MFVGIDPADLPIEARITSAVLVGTGLYAGRWVYGFQQVNRSQATGIYEDSVPGISGRYQDPASAGGEILSVPALELNNKQVEVGTIVTLYRIQTRGVLGYQFDIGPAPAMLMLLTNRDQDTAGTWYYEAEELDWKPAAGLISPKVGGLVLTFANSYVLSRENYEFYANASNGTHVYVRLIGSYGGLPVYLVDSYGLWIRDRLGVFSRPNINVLEFDTNDGFSPTVHPTDPNVVIIKQSRALQDGLGNQVSPYNILVLDPAYFSFTSPSQGVASVTFVGGSGPVDWLNVTNTPTTLAGYGITDAQPLDATLTALAAYNTDGIVCQTAANTFAGRTLAAPAAGLTITNPGGVAGNPTFALANDLAALEALSGTNTIYYRSAADTWSAVTIGAGLTFSAGTLDSAGSNLLTSANTWTAQNTFAIDDATNNGTTHVVRLRHTTTGTAAAGMGVGMLMSAENSDGNLQSLALIDASFATVGGSWTPRFAIDCYDGAGQRNALRLGTNGSAATISFLGATEAVRQTGDVGTALVTFGLMSGTPTYNAANLTGTIASARLPAASESAVGGVEFADQAEMEAASSTTLAVSPGRLRHHPGVAKGWVLFDGTGTPTIRASHNVSSITDEATGSWTINWNTDFSGQYYGITGLAGGSGVGRGFLKIDDDVDPAAGTTRVEFIEHAAGVLTDVEFISVAVFGDQ